MKRRKQWIDSQIGKRFGRLVVVGADQVRRGQYKITVAAVECDCGNGRTVDPANLRSGRTQSCGCAKSGRKGNSNHPDYATWYQMIRRCTISTHPKYPSYGARGIAVCSRWRKFENFVSDMGPRPEGGTLDRIDNDGNYEPGNCRWATRKTQQNNLRRNRYVEHEGERLTLSEWQTRTGIPASVISKRLNRGWPVLRALTQRPSRHIQCR